MTKELMLEKLKSLGLKKSYIPEFESETGTILIKTRKPADIIDGLLVGSEIALTPNRMTEGMFLIWSHRKKLAWKICGKYGLKCKHLTGEAEFLCPASLGDVIFPMFGARLRQSRTVPTETMAKMRAGLARYRANKNIKSENPVPNTTLDSIPLAKSIDKTGVPEI